MSELVKLCRRHGRPGTTCRHRASFTSERILTRATDRQIGDDLRCLAFRDRLQPNDHDQRRQAAGASGVKPVRTHPGLRAAYNSMCRVDGVYCHEGFLLAIDAYRASRLGVRSRGRDLGWEPRPLEGVGVSGSFWRDRPTLVTGAAGLLGSWMMHRLGAAGAHVVGLDVSWSHGGSLGPTPGATSVDGDVRDANAVERILARSGIDTVIHLAAQSLVGPANEHPVPTFETNIAGTWTVLEAARLNPTVRRIVVASSDKAYGDTGGDPYEESMPLLARHPYAVSKACADLLAQAYAASFDMPVAVSRCGNLYGGGDLNWSRVIPGTIRSVIEGQRPVIRSDGSYVRDYLYVEDAVEGVLRVAEDVGEHKELHGETFNFGAGERLSVLDVVHRILSVMRSNLDPDIRNEAENEIPEQRVSASKSRTMLGWEPTYTLDQGLERTIAWYREHLKATS